MLAEAIELEKVEGFPLQCVRMEGVPRKPVSLWELMKSFQLNRLAISLTELQQHYDDCLNGRDAAANHQGSFPISPPSKPGTIQLKNMMVCLDSLEKICTEIGLSAASSQIGLIHMHHEQFDGQADYSEWCGDLRNALNVLMGDMWHVQVVQVESGHSDWVNNESLFGTQVKSVFKEACGDIREAGNCIAVGSGTAAVFHLMRVAECGILKLCEHLGITRVRRSNKPKEKKYIPIDYTQWEKMWGAINAKVDAKLNKLRPGKRKQETGEFYYSLLQDIKGFKDAYRNHVMHNRKNYSTKEAEAVFEHVKRFMSSLADKLGPQADWLEDL
jgi:hypothetical protein